MKLVILSSGRCGGRYVSHVIRSAFPGSCVFGEIFRKGGDSIATLATKLQTTEDEVKTQLAQHPQTIWRNLDSVNNSNINAARIFYYHRKRNSELWETLREDTRIVHVIRRNPFNILVSRKIAEKTGVWENSKNTINIPHFNTVVMQPDYVKQEIRKYISDVEWARDKFIKNDYHELYFEEICYSAKTCATMLREILSDWELPFNPEVTIGLQRIKNSGNFEIVKNYADIAYLDHRFL
ncbi:hypothetical protein [Roseibium sp.]|uniref:hypothetical protein n=1 Tax=Roseibium sp. TaxID=1936156 RepID=UPI003BADA97E